MKKPHLPSTIYHLLLASLLLFTSPQVQATTYTWSNVANGTTVVNGNWSGGESWLATAPASAADTTLSIGYTYGINTAAETNTLTNNIANPFQLNVLSLTGNSNAGAGSSVALINIAGSPLEFVSNGGTTPQVNLSSVRTTGQVISFDVQTGVVLTNNTLFTGNGTANFTISGAISGGGNFTKGGTSRLVLSGTNSYGGTTTISGGMLQFTKQVSLYNNNTVAGGWTAANISVASGAILALSVGGTGEFTTANVTTILNNLGGANGSSSGGFAAGSTIGLVNAGTVSIADTITNTTGTGGGALAVTKFGAGVLTLTGANTYTGNTSILQGSLTLAPTAGGMNLGAITATTGGTTNIAAAGNITLTLGGAGTNTITSITETSNAAQQLILTKNTTATWSVGNVDLKQGNGSTVSSGVLNLNGTLQFGLAAGTLRQFTVSGGTLGYNNAGAVKTIGTTTSAVGSGTWLTFSGGALDNLSGTDITTSTNNPNLRLEAGLTFTGTNSLNFGTGLVSLGSAAGTSRTITVSANTLTLNGVISVGTTATALTKAGNGTLALGGANSYSGITTISAGKLTILSAGTINSSSSVSIGAGEFNYNSSTALSKVVSFSGTGGKLSGSGTITPAVTISSGNTLAPGNSIGTLTFGTGLTIAGTYQAELGTPGATPAAGVSDRAVVTGNLDLTGGTLQLIDNAGANAQGSAGAGAYRLITFTGSRTGTFGTVTNPLSSTLHESVVYNGASNGTVDLNLYRLASASAHTPEPMDLGVIHLGDSFANQALSLTNNATNDGFSEKLSASIGSATGDATASGSFGSLLAAGSTNNTDLTVSLSNTVGAKSGTATISLSSDGTGTSGYGSTSIGTQTVNVSGAVFNGNATWTGTGSSWGTGASANWVDSNSVNAAPGTFAGFGGVDTASFTNAGIANLAVSLNGTSPNLNAIVFNSSSSYTVAQGSSGSITLAGTTPSIATTGTHAISAPVTLGANSTFTTNASSRLTVSGAIGESGGARSLTVSGPGTTVLSNATGNSYTGGTSVNSNGILLVQNTSNSATGSGDVTVAGGSKLGGTGLITASSINITGDLFVGNTHASGGTAETLTLGAAGGNVTLGGMVQFDILSQTGTGSYAAPIYATTKYDQSNSNDLLRFTSSNLITLNGILDVASSIAYTSFAAGDTWQIFDWGGFNHDISGLNVSSTFLPDLHTGTTGLTWDVLTSTTNLGTFGTISVVGVPEPSRAVLLFIGAAGLLMRRRRARLGAN